MNKGTLMFVHGKSLLNPVAHFFSQRFFRFIDKRVHPANEHVLNRKKLYIFPSLRGFALILILLVLWLLGTNYQNNMILALAFLLTSVFVVAILHTHKNLSSLHVDYIGTSPAFAGEEVDFIFCLRTGSTRFAENLEVGWQEADDKVVNIDVPSDDVVRVRIPLASHKRGWLKPGRMLVQSYFPLGILRCWSWLNWDVAALIYPSPMPGPLSGQAKVDDTGEGLHPVRGGEDYSGLREYTPGDSLKLVSWKHYAQEKGLYVKEFSQNVSEERWLDFSDIPIADVEKKLSILCYWVLQFSQRDEPFGLLLPGLTVGPDKGENHRRQLLESLAMFKG
ncbi:DUF58 domain-containing protein [Teredinibacter franksiae]|uniref:DUF58 domain-containing protein n=1 Tax=Teredinibacter franksiae TaxID=2761453 RepID=UPI001FEA1D0C|nr:DUF58 domain-containing protein [Teredinibacter franksiae]